eukprot:jgi/Mesvir1/20799/Mv07903-RA.1
MAFVSTIVQLPRGSTSTRQINASRVSPRASSFLRELAVHSELHKCFSAQFTPCLSGKRNNIVTAMAKAKKRSPDGSQVQTKYLQVDPGGADVWRLREAVDSIKEGGLGVIPTDTMYAFVCDLEAKDAINAMYRIKEMSPKKPLSILCRSFADIDTYTTGFPHYTAPGQPNVFRAAKQCLPGPYTFILAASKNLPRQCIEVGGRKGVVSSKKKTVGVRMPNHPVCAGILEQLERPLLCSSVTLKDDPDGWMLDPALILDEYGRQGLSFVVDSGILPADPSTIVDLTDGVKVLREGKGDPSIWNAMAGEEVEEKGYART